MHLPQQHFRYNFYVWLTFKFITSQTPKFSQGCVLPPSCWPLIYYYSKFVCFGQFILVLTLCMRYYKIVRIWLFCKLYADYLCSRCSHSLSQDLNKTLTNCLYVKQCSDVSLSISKKIPLLLIFTYLENYVFLKISFRLKQIK